MKMLVTGGAGFIGSHLVDRLIHEGYEVVVVDNLSTGHRCNIHPNARFYELDIRSEELQKVFQAERPTVVSHHAAQVNVRKSVDDPVFDAEVNIVGTLNVLQQCVRFHVQKIVFASSGGAIYREPKSSPLSERSPIDPLSGYGIGKLAGDLYLKYFHRTLGLQCVSLRYANVYGPRQDPFGEAGVVAIFSKKLLSGEPPVIHGTGTQTRDFVYVADVVDAHMTTLNANIHGIFNVGTGKETSINQVFRYLARIIDPRIRPIFGPPKKGEAMRNALDASRLRKQLGWKPRVSMKAGLRKTVEAFRRDGGE